MDSEKVFLRMPSSEGVLVASVEQYGEIVDEYTTRVSIRHRLGGPKALELEIDVDAIAMLARDGDTSPGEKALIDEIQGLFRELGETIREDKGEG